MFDSSLLEPLLRLVWKSGIPLVISIYYQWSPLTKDRPHILQKTSGIFEDHNISVLVEVYIYVVQAFFGHFEKKQEKTQVP